MRDGKVVNLRRYDYGDIEQQGCCQRCYGNIERMYSDRRILHPMRRVGERGSGEFEVITWDEAIEDICTNLKRVADEYGPGVRRVHARLGNSMLPDNYYVRLANYIGAARMAAMFDQNGQQAILKRMGNGEGYMPRADDYRRMLDAKYIFIWGTNPSESMSVSYRMFTLARERGAKLICIDPIYNTIAAHSDVWIPIRPGSDGLLAMAMLKIAIRDGHVDEEFLRTRTVAPYLVKDADGMYLRLSDLGRAEAGSEEDAVLVYDHTASGACPAGPACHRLRCGERRSGPGRDRPRRAGHLQLRPRRHLFQPDHLRHVPQGSCRSLHSHAAIWRRCRERHHDHRARWSLVRRHGGRDGH